MQYINHKTNTLYSGDRASWRDTPVTSERPGTHYRPVVEDGNHTGWEFAEDAAERAYQSAIGRLKSAHAAALSDAHDRYAPTEREGWHELVKDAELGSGECLEAYAEDLGISVSDAAARVLSSRDKYRAAYGKATGHLTKLRDQADALFDAGDVDGLKALDWSVS